MITESSLIDSCKKNNYKITPQRLAIFRILMNKNRHISADQVYDEISQEHPYISFNTVYMTLNMLVEIGEIKELLINKERTFYDTNNEDHHHIICKVCNSIEDLYLEKPIQIPNSVKENYQINECKIAFYGICKNCK